MSSPRPPTTPASRRRLPPTTPATGHSVTNCSSDPVQFQKVEIHTAKCSVCDERNKTDLMLRCPGCTWQICKPCQDQRTADGQSLAHGNMGTPSATATTPIVRRKLFKQTPSAATNQKQDAKDVSVVKEKDDAAQGLKRDLAQEATPPTSAEKRKLDRKTKNKAPVMDPSSDYEMAFEIESPTQDRKRQKTAEGTRVGSRVGSSVGNTPLPRRTRLATPQQPPTSEASMSSPSNIDVRRSAGWRQSDRPDPIQEAGIHVHYDEHLLRRPEPVMAARTESSIAQQQVGTIGDFCKSAARELCEAEAKKLSEGEKGIKLKPGDQETLLKAIEAAGITVASIAREKLPLRLRKMTQEGLDMLLEDLDKDQTEELKNDIEEESNRVLEKFKKKPVSSGSAPSPAEPTPAAHTGNSDMDSPPKPFLSSSAPPMALDDGAGSGNPDKEGTAKTQVPATFSAERLPQ